MYEEKLEASEIFKDKKALYPSRYLQFNWADYCLIHVHFDSLMGRAFSVYATTNEISPKCLLLWHYFFLSVSQPFKGDYLEISKNPKYQKLNSAVDEKVLLADVVNKINRANGKVRSQGDFCLGIRFCCNDSFLHNLKIPPG